MPEWTMIPLSRIGYDPEYYPRVNGDADWMTIHRYKEAVSTHPDKADPSNPGAFPAVVVVRATGYEWPYLYLDGLHRGTAFASAGLEKIAAVVERLPKSRWLERSVELNIDGKRTLDSGDKRWVATRLAADGWKPEKIASLLCMEQASFEKLVATNITKLTQSSAKLIRSGRSNRQIGGEHYGFLKAPFTDVSGTGNAQKALRMQDRVASREALQIVESFVALLESKAVDLTDERIADGLRRASDLIGRLAVAAQ